MVVVQGMLAGTVQQTLKNGWSTEARAKMGFPKSVELGIKDSRPNSQLASLAYRWQPLSMEDLVVDQALCALPPTRRGTVEDFLPEDCT